MEELSELLLQRRRKVNDLWAAGINPYPNDFKPQHTSADVIAAYGSVEQIDAVLARWKACSGVLEVDPGGVDLHLGGSDVVIARAHIVPEVDYISTPCSG